MRTLLFVVLVFTVNSVFAQSVQGSSASGQPYGDFDLSLHSIQILRDYSLPSPLSDVSLDAGSISANMSYNYSISSFHVGMQYVAAFTQFSNTDDSRIKADYALSINEYQVLNQLYVDYSFGADAVNKHYLRIGRQVLNLNFVTANKLRHKEQAFEAVVLNFEPMENLKFSVGHLAKYSTWSSKTVINGEELKNKFVDIALAEGSDSGKGIQFMDSEWALGSQLILQFYDYYWQDLYNTAGLNIDYQMDFSHWVATFSGRYIQQDDVGDALNQVKSVGYQLHAAIEDQHWRIESGLFITGGQAAEDSIHSPFAVNLAIEKPLFETGLAPIGGSESIYFEGAFRAGKHSFDGLVFYTDVYEAGFNSSSKEFDCIYAFSWTESLTLKLKFAKVKQRLTNRVYSVNDYRLFVDYVF